MHIHPSKFGLIVLSAYLFVICFLFTNLIATPLSLIALLLLLEPAHGPFNKRFGERGIATITTILILFVVIHQNFLMV